MCNGRSYINYVCIATYMYVLHNTKWLQLCIYHIKYNYVYVREIVRKLCSYTYVASASAIQKWLLVMHAPN